MTVEEKIKIVETSATKSEKASWKRKQKNLEKLIADLDPLEEMVLDVTNKKIKIIDKISMIRSQMVQECIHPHDFLVMKSDDEILCKFCNKTLGIVIKAE